MRPMDKGGRRQIGPVKKKPFNMFPPQTEADIRRPAVPSWAAKGKVVPRGSNQPGAGNKNARVEAIKRRMSGRN